jgi:hypothetical protein
MTYFQVYEFFKNHKQYIEGEPFALYDLGWNVLANKNLFFREKEILISLPFDENFTFYSFDENFVNLIQKGVPQHQYVVDDFINRILLKRINNFTRIIKYEI